MLVASNNHSSADVSPAIPGRWIVTAPWTQREKSEAS
jgi:hypothetical protein